MPCSKTGPNQYKSPRGKTLTRRQAARSQAMTGSKNPNSRANRANRARRGRQKGR